MKGMLSDIRLYLRHFIPLPHRVPSHLTSILFSSISLLCCSKRGSNIMFRQIPLRPSSLRSLTTLHKHSSSLLCFELSSISQVPNHHTLRTRSTRPPSLPRSIRTMTLEILPLGCFTLDLPGCSRHIALATTT
jgi:hypothetical protein